MLCASAQLCRQNINAEEIFAHACVHTASIFADSYAGMVDDIIFNEVQNGKSVHY